MKKKCLTGFHLKTIALVSMFIDHLSTVLLTNLLTSASLNGTGFLYDHQDLFWTISNVMRWFGRLAFPLYCFLLVEGFLHTKSRAKYAVRLLLFAFLSEIPFDMAFSGCILERYYNNVFFTLFLSFLMLWIVETLENRLKNSVLCKVIFWILLFVIYRAFSYLATFVFWSDYDSSGLLVVLVIYLFRNKKTLGQAIASLLLFIISLTGFQIFGLLTVPLVSMYNGEKGPSMKYAFYCFYPLHLFVLVGFAILLGAVHLKGILL